MINFLRKISNVFFWLKFCLNNPCRNTVLLVEINDYHTELFPSFVHYLNKLDYNVEIMANFGQIGNLPKLNVKNIYYFSLSGFKKIFKSKKIKEYNCIIFTSNEIYWSYSNEVEANAKVIEKFKPECKTILTIHDTSEIDDSFKNSKGAIVLSEVLNKDKEENLFVVNPCYFKNNIQKNKNKKTVFVTVGKLESARKNSDILFDSARKLLKEGIGNFEIIIIGNNNKNLLPDDLRNILKITGKLNFKNMFKILSSADFYLPLLDSDNKKHLRYITTGTSGSFQLIRGFLLPPVIHNIFAHPNGFSEENAIIYEKDFHNALKECIDMNNSKYLKLQDNLLESRNKLMASSICNFEILLNKLNCRS